jgi:hypothetical protein
VNLDALLSCLIQCVEKWSRSYSLTIKDKLTASVIYPLIFQKMINIGIPDYRMEDSVKHSIYVNQMRSFSYDMNVNFHPTGSIAVVKEGLEEMKKIFDLFLKSVTANNNPANVPQQHLKQIFALWFQAKLHCCLDSFSAVEKNRITSLSDLFEIDSNNLSPANRQLLLRFRLPKWKGSQDFFIHENESLKERMNNIEDTAPIFEELAATDLSLPLKKVLFLNGRESDCFDHLLIIRSDDPKELPAVVFIDTRSKPKAGNPEEFDLSRHHLLLHSMAQFQDNPAISSPKGKSQVLLSLMKNNFIHLFLTTHGLPNTERNPEKRWGSGKNYLIMTRQESMKYLSLIGDCYDVFNN